jgi:6-pyruvoyltetrahydropterin/6-carboxytetrahydropterin synthase
MLTATKRFTFDASHQLPNHAGKCKQLHGHTYILEVTVEANPDCYPHFSEQGFFVDFGELKEIVGDELDRWWDHKHLNETVDPNPTAERLILHLWNSLAPKLRATCLLCYLKLYETPNCWVEYDGHDADFSHLHLREELRKATPDGTDASQGSNHPFTSTGRP